METVPDYLGHWAKIISEESETSVDEYGFDLFPTFAWPLFEISEEESDLGYTKVLIEKESSDDLNEKVEKLKAENKELKAENKALIEENETL